MWILLVIILSQPFQVGSVGILGIFLFENQCESERVRAVDLGPPDKMNIGCLRIEGVSQAHGNRAF
jgi:hypothetical protein